MLLLIIVQLIALQPTSSINHETFFPSPLQQRSDVKLLPNVSSFDRKLIYINRSQALLIIFYPLRWSIKYFSQKLGLREAIFCLHNGSFPLPPLQRRERLLKTRKGRSTLIATLQRVCLSWYYFNVVKGSSIVDCLRRFVLGLWSPPRGGTKRLNKEERKCSTRAWINNEQCNDVPQALGNGW